MSYRATLFLMVLIIAGCNQGLQQKEIPAQSPQSWQMTGFTKADTINPILSPSTDMIFRCPVSKMDVRWESRNVLNPAAVVKNGKVYLIYRAQDNEMTSRLGLAVSEDGLHFRKEQEPVFYPDNDSMKIYEWKGGVEDPRVTESEDGMLIMTYTAYDGKTARLCLATSRDLKSWTKHGLVLSSEKYRNWWSKSGAIISKEENGRLVAARVAGKYWMYFGDTDLYMATSDDLIHWNPIEDPESNRLIAVMIPRPGYFDSRLVEPGPCALLIPEGILLFYNGSNAGRYGDTSLSRFAYSGGQAMFDRDNPLKLIDRCKRNFIYPDKPYEKTGEVNEVCFIEGLVNFNSKWYLYYGTADSKIAVSVKEAELNYIRRRTNTSEKLFLDRLTAVKELFDKSYSRD